MSDTKLGEKVSSRQTVGTAQNDPYQRSGAASAPAQSTRDQIVDAALQCFGDKGYHGTTVRDIANMVNLSVPGIYHHFPSKMALLEKLMNDTMDDLVGDIRHAYERSPPLPVSRFEAVVAAHVRFHCERRVESFIGNSELRSLPAAARGRLVKKRDEVQRYFEIVVTDGIDAEIFDVRRPHEASRALASMCVAVAAWYRRGGPLTPDDVVAVYRDLGLELVGFEDPAR